MTMDIAPEDQDKLAQLFGGKLGGNAADLFAARSGGAAPAPMSMPGMPGATTVAPRPAPQASDDPMVTGQPAVTSPMPGAAPKLPTVPTFQPPPLGPMQDLSQKIAAASQPVRRQDNQPHWWERLLAPVVAGVEGYGNAKQGIDAGNSVLNRRYNLAVENQKKTVSPLEAEFERQSKIEPYIRDSNENSQRTYQDQMEGATETREQGTAASNAQYKSDLNEIKQNIADNKLDEAQRRLDETSEKNRNNLDVQQQMLSIRQQLADARDRQVDKGKDKATSGAQSRLIETKKQAELDKAEEEYQKEIGDLDQMQKMLSHGGKKAPDDSADRAAAQQRLEAKKQRAQDAYEAEVAAAGGTPTHLDVRGGQKPAASPAQSSTPATAPNAATKTVPKTTVQSYADAHKVGNRQMTYDEALQGFQSKGYKVQ